ncbi:unnamed protein product, partial [Discosporangium mesarthrocarpum]
VPRSGETDSNESQDCCTDPKPWLGQGQGQGQEKEQASGLGVASVAIAGVDSGAVAGAGAGVWKPSAGVRKKRAVKRVGYARSEGLVPPALSVTDGGAASGVERHGHQAGHGG